MITAWMLYAAAGAGVAVSGVMGLLLADHPVRRILALNVASSGVFLIIVASARRAPSGLADPVPHALVLTGIVVSVSATALALALVRRMARAEARCRASPDRERHHDR